MALLARNSRWFVLAVAALDKLGATVLYMNTGFAGPQLAEVLAREGCELLLHDDEFSEAVAGYLRHLADVGFDETPIKPTMPPSAPGLVAPVALGGGIGTIGRLAPGPGPLTACQYT